MQTIGGAISPTVSYHDQGLVRILTKGHVSVVHSVMPRMQILSQRPRRSVVVVVRLGGSFLETVDRRKRRDGRDNE